MMVLLGLILYLTPLQQMVVEVGEAITELACQEVLVAAHQPKDHRAELRPKEIAAVVQGTETLVRVWRQIVRETVVVARALLEQRVGYTLLAQQMAVPAVLVSNTASVERQLITQVVAEAVLLVRLLRIVLVVLAETAAVELVVMEESVQEEQMGLRVRLTQVEEAVEVEFQKTQQITTAARAVPASSLSLPQHPRASPSSPAHSPRPVHQALPDSPSRRIHPPLSLSTPTSWRLSPETEEQHGPPAP